MSCFPNWIEAHMLHLSVRENYIQNYIKKGQQSIGILNCIGPANKWIDFLRSISDLKRKKTIAQSLWQSSFEIDSFYPCRKVFLNLKSVIRFVQVFRMNENLLSNKNMEFLRNPDALKLNGNGYYIFHLNSC